MNRHHSQTIRGTLLALALLALAGCDGGSSAGANMTNSSGTSGGASAATLPFSGSFHTSYQGQPSAITLEQSGSSVNGTLDGANLAGNADGNTARGDVKDPQSNQVGGTFELTRRGEELDLRLTLRDPESGQTLTLPTITYKKGEPPPMKAELDPQLVGRWRFTSTYVSGEFSAASDTWFILSGDGTYAYGGGKVGAGDASASAVTGDGDFERGRWRAEDRILYLATGDAGAPWQRLGRYYADGERMMLTYDNGNKKVWERQ